MRLGFCVSVVGATAAAGVAVGAAGCGGGAAPDPATSPVAATSLGVRTFGALGSLLVLGDGRTVYVNAGERGVKTACTGSCAAAWPLVVSGPGGPPTLATGIRPALLSSRQDGGRTAVTYAGYPLHVYVGDTVAGDDNGQGVQQVWSGITVNGAPAR